MMMMMMEMDGFDQLPDSLILQIFNSVSDIKTLARCRSVSKRFNSLIPQTDSLSLRVDRVISPESDYYSDSLLFSIFKSLLKSLHDLFKPTDPNTTNTNNKKSHPIRSIPTTRTSPAQILSRFDRIRSLQIELPAGDLKLEKGVVIKWRADFGKTLKSCVILGFRSSAAENSERWLLYNDDVGNNDFAGDLKTRVVWTISSLIAASARHYLLKEVVKVHKEMERLVLKDREGEGTVVMDKNGLSECRAEMTAAISGGGVGGAERWEWETSRTVVPSVRMRMRHEPRLRLKNGVWLEGATLVVVRPCCGGGGVQGGDGGGGDVEDAELAMGAFGDDGEYGEAVQVLLKSKSYLLEMNSF